MASNRRLVFVLAVLFSLAFRGSPQAQGNKYLVFFRDKVSGNPFSLNNPTAFLSQRSVQRRAQQNLPLDSTDLPVKPAYLQGLRNAGASVLYPLRWVNGAIVACTPEVLSSLLSLPYVENGEILNSGKADPPVRNPVRQGTQSLDYGPSGNQNIMLGIDSMHAWGFRGEGKLIAVFDAGFLNVNSHPAFAHLIQNNRIAATRDLVSPGSDVFQGHWHGGGVLSNIAAFAPGSLVGGAYNADFLLIRSEDDASEYEVECAYWAAALELADSAGADLVNSSLGYTTFDNPSLNYSFGTLDGQTSVASRTAGMAARKGMVVITSAGNEGNSQSWEGRISVPGDARDILTIGSVGGNGIFSSFSGKGPTADGRIKPDLVAQGGGTVIANVSAAQGFSTGNGTSFSSPMVCGMAAGLWQAHPGLTALQLIQLLKNSGSNRLNPDNQLGWGIPSFIRAHILAGARPQLSFPFEILVYPNPGTVGHRLFIEVLDDKVAGTADVRLIDTRGREVLRQSIVIGPEQQVRELPVPSVRAGLYQMQVELNGQAFRRKLIIR